MVGANSSEGFLVILIFVHTKNKTKSRNKISKYRDILSIPVRENQQQRKHYQVNPISNPYSRHNSRIISNLLPNILNIVLNIFISLGTFSSGDRELLRMTLTFELDLHSISIM